MNIQMKNEYRYEIELSREELDRLDITYDALDYGNVETRRVLWTLLDEIRKKFNTVPDMSGKLLIEAKALPGDRCLIAYTFLPSAKNRVSVKQLVKLPEAPLCVFFGSVDDAVFAAKSCDFCGTSALYEKNGKYALVLHTAGNEKEKLAHMLGEFGDMPKDGNVAYLHCEECWRCITKTDAVKKLALLA